MACTFLNSKITCFLNTFQYVKWHNWIGDKHEVDLSTSIKPHSQLSACSKQIYLHSSLEIVSNLTPLNVKYSPLSVRYGPAGWFLTLGNPTSRGSYWKIPVGLGVISVHYQGPKDTLSLKPFLSPPQKSLVPFPPWLFWLVASWFLFRMTLKFTFAVWMCCLLATAELMHLLQS